MNNNIRIFDASDTGTLSQDVCNILGVEPGKTTCSKFRDQDTDIHIGESVRGRDIYVFQYYIPPIGERLYELNLILNGLIGGGYPERATVVFPFAFGSRGDRRTKPRQPINSVVVAQDLKVRNVNRLLTLGIHNTMIGSIYDTLSMGFDNLDFEDLAAHYILEHLNKPLDNITIGSPDVGGASRCRSLIKILRENGKIEPNLAICDKYRPEPNISKITYVIGDVEGKDVILYDDIGDTMGSIVKSAEAIKEKGAKSISAILIHPVLSEKKNEENGAKENIDYTFEKCYLDEIIFSNTIPLKPFIKEYGDKVKIINVAPLFAEAISRLHNNQSISALHNYNGVVAQYHKIENTKAFFI